MSLSRRDLILGLGATTLMGATNPVMANSHSNPFKQGSSTKNWVALTFDDGPHPTLTPKLLDHLKERRLKATFYLIGWRVKQNPQLVKRIAREGHDIGNHSYWHPNLAAVGNKRLLNEIDKTNAAIVDVIGKKPKTMRPPYGALSLRQSRLLLEERKLPSIMWSLDTRDWKRPGSHYIANRIINHAQSGSVILSHDIHGATIRAMPKALDHLKKEFRLVTISKMIAQS